MKEAEGTAEKTRTEHALQMFADHPQLFPSERRASILQGITTLGMTPYEAHLASGEFSYRVVADGSVWPEHSDPTKVMWQQSIQPDKSEIWMLFNNRTQFRSAEPLKFKVHFLEGKAFRINRIDESEAA